MKSFAKPPASITTSITSRFDDDASPSGQRAASRSTASTAPGSSGMPLPVDLEQPLDDLRVDLLRLPIDRELVAHVGRPLRRAHPEHRAAGLLLPGPAPLVDDGTLRGEPGRLRVEQDTVEVEDDGVDQGLQASGGPCSPDGLPRSRRRARDPRSPRRTRPGPWVGAPRASAQSWAPDRASVSGSWRSQDGIRRSPPHGSSSRGIALLLSTAQTLRLCSAARNARRAGRARERGTRESNPNLRFWRPPS